MKTKKPLSFFLALLLGFSSALNARDGSSREGADPPVTIEFVNIKDYTDLGSGLHPLEADRNALAEEFRKAVLPIASRYVPKGHHLTLRFLDIDMAGDFEPHRGAEMADVRILRSIYPPRFAVEYRVIGPAGDIVSSGRRGISDLDYQNVVTFRRDEKLFYETELAAQLIREIMRTL